MHRCQPGLPGSMLWRPECMDNRIQGDPCAYNIVVAISLFDIFLCHASCHCTCLPEQKSARRLKTGCASISTAPWNRPRPQNTVCVNMRSMPGVIGGTACLAACGAGALMAYGVRGRSSTLFAPSVYRGPASRHAIALTFDDGPSESTPALLRVLADHDIPATFFQCGANVERLPEIACEVVRRGHEIGNHSHTHPRFYFRNPAFIFH